MASQRKLHVLIFELAPFAFHKLSCDACMLFSVYVCVCVCASGNRHATDEFINTVPKVCMQMPYIYQICLSLF